MPPVIRRCSYRMLGKSYGGWTAPSTVSGSSPLLNNGGVEYRHDHQRGQAGGGFDPNAPGPRGHGLFGSRFGVCQVRKKDDDPLVVGRTLRGHSDGPCGSMEQSDQSSSRSWINRVTVAFGRL